MVSNGVNVGIAGGRSGIRWSVAAAVITLAVVTEIVSEPLRSACLLRRLSAATRSGSAGSGAKGTDLGRRA